MHFSSYQMPKKERSSWMTCLPTGEPEAARPEELIWQNWNEESWSTGAFTSFVTPGAWTTYGQSLQESHGRIH